MDPLLASSLLSLAPSVFEGGSGIGQLFRAKNYDSARPTYNTPQPVNDNVTLAKRLYNAANSYGLPGQGRIEAKIDESSAGARRGIENSQQDPASMLLGYSAVDKNTKDSYADLGVKAANFRNQNISNTASRLMGANNVLAQYKDREFDWNEKQPYEADMRMASALRNAGMQNILTGITGAADTGASYAIRQPGSDGNRMADPNGGVADASNVSLQGQTALTAQDKAAMPSIFSTEYTPQQIEQFPNIFGKSVVDQYGEMRKSYPYNVMSDEEFYNAIGATMQGPTQTPNVFTANYQ